MKILFTGASSFTGCWFVRALTAAGHEVLATFRRPGPDAYEDELTRRRVQDVTQRAQPLWGVSFGDGQFLAALHEGVQAVCHHGADVTDYKSPDFDYARALTNNTLGLKTTMEQLARNGGRFILTGSVFEGGEGIGTQNLPHFSPYGLSKALTAQAAGYFADQLGLAYGKFVIPNPFGPMEAPRFTAYLVRTWYAGNTPQVKTPAYVRDNIHVDLLARAYASFVSEARVHQPGGRKLGPSGYVESQGAFAKRFAAEMAPRLGINCPVDLAHQTEFPEPRVRINIDAPDAASLGFDESAAWDAIAEFYRGVHSG